MTLHHLMLFVHLAGVIVWVGGMSFAHFCLRPASLALPPPQRLALWHGVLARFFPIVWLATGGGPLNATETIATYTYKLAFSRHEFALASASGVILFLVSMVVALVYVRHQKARD